MELESMKNLWQAHDQSLKKLSTINEQLVRRMINDRSHSSLEKIKTTEYWLAIVCVLGLVIFLFMGWRLDNRPELIASYIITLLALLLTIAWYVYKIVFLSKIDISGGTITDTTKKITRFHMFIVKELLWSLISMVVVIPAVYILVFNWVKHQSAFAHVPFSLAQNIIAIVLVILGSLVVYSRVYFNNLKTIMANLKEIEDFEKEN